MKLLTGTVPVQEWRYRYVALYAWDYTFEPRLELPTDEHQQFYSARYHHLQCFYRLKFKEPLKELKKLY